MTRMQPDGFAAAFRERFPDLVGAPIVVALSGGGDSVALLLLVREANEQLGCSLFAAHVHHHLRGEQADADAQFCAELCNRIGVPIAVEHLGPERPTGLSPEAWWRQQRYRALEDVRRRCGAAAVATAHTRDDQAETVLLKLLRGAGPRGVAGIRARSGNVIRPLLEVPRSALREYLSLAGVGWREDATNLDISRPRSRVRQALLPALEDAFPGASRQLAAFAATLGEDEALLAEQLRETVEWPEVGRSVPLATVASLPEPLLRRWVLELAARLPLREPPSRQQLDQVEALLAGAWPAAVDLGRRWVLRRSGGRLVLAPPPLRGFPEQPAALGCTTALPGGFVARLGAPAQGEVAHRAWLSRAAAAQALAWRSVKAGERFGSSRRPIARALASAGIPKEWRCAWPVLIAGGTMVWLPGIGVAVGWEGNEDDGLLAEVEEPWGRHVR
jgi:tRNA(Ile)-lysidine synthase